MTLTTYYLASAFTCFCCCLALPSALSDRDSFLSALLVSLILGWLLWPAVLFGVIINIRK